MFVLGLDIAYSNFKAVYGDLFRPINEAHSVIKPAGAAPLSKLSRSLMGNNEMIVDIDGVPWVACVEPTRIDRWKRELHDQYPKTDQYKALFKAALLMTDRTEIDILVIDCLSFSFLILALKMH